MPLDYVEPKKEPEPENEIIEKKQKRSIKSYSKTAKKWCVCAISGVGYKLGNK